MKLTHPDLDYQFEICPTTPCQWIIESPELMAEYVEEIYRQTNGDEGRFVLSEAGEEQKFSQHIEIIINPFSLDFNNRSFLNKLYANLAEIAHSEEVYLATQELFSTIQQYCLEIEEHSDYMLSTNADIDISCIFKGLGIQFENYSDNFFENINQYMNITAKLMHKKIIIFISLGQYLNEEQMKLLVQNARYQELMLIFIENSQRSFSQEVKRYIIDTDGCEIF